MSDKFNRFQKWKILLYSDRLHQLAQGRMPYPLVWHIYPSNYCPLNCNFCIMREEKEQNKAMLSLEAMTKIPFDAECIAKVKLVHFSGGGEPLTNPYVRGVALTLKKKGLVKVALSTNGLLLEPSDVIYFNHIRVSVDAVQQETYRKIKDGSLDMVIDNIKRVMTFKKEHNVDVDVGLGYVVTLDNIQETTEFMDLAKQLQVDFVHFRPCYYPNSSNQNVVLKQAFTEATPQNLEHASKIDSPKIYWLGYKFKGTWTQRNYTKCRSTPLQAVLTATGEFIICQDVFIRWGNYYKQTFNQIWFSPEHFETIEKINLEKCPRCVESFHNEVIEHMFLSNECRNELV